MHGGPFARRMGGQVLMRGGWVGVGRDGGRDGGRVLVRTMEHISGSGGYG